MRTSPAALVSGVEAIADERMPRKTCSAPSRALSATFPVNPPLFAWTEWEWYKTTGDKERLRRVLLPLVKHYEWWMLYQRRENGLYWVDGVNEADDSPRNGLMHYSVSATSYPA